MNKTTLLLLPLLMAGSLGLAGCNKKPADTSASPSAPMTTPGTSASSPSTGGSAP